MRSILRIALLLSSLFGLSGAASGCGSSVSHAAFACPEKGGAPWTEVQSAHFTLRTDLSREAAQEASRAFEAMFSSLADLGFASPLEMHVHMDVVYFRRREDYEQVAPRASVGAFDRETRDFERTPLILVQGDLTERTREVIQHELTHNFVHALYPQAPIWLNEGLAQYFSTLQLEDGSAVLGRSPRSLRFWNGPWSAKNVDGETAVAIPKSAAPPVSSLLAMSALAFEGAANVDPRAPASMDAMRNMAANYAGAFSLVHLLLSNPMYRPLFEQYRQQLMQGQPNEAAWGETVGRVSPEKLQTDYQNALVSFETLTYRTKYTPPASSAGVRALTDADVHVTWARLRNWKTAEGDAAARNDMAEAARRAPHHPELALLTAYREHEAGNDAIAREALNGALAEHPDDARLLNALGWIALGHDTAKGAAARELPPIAQKLEPLAKTAAELDLLGRSRAIGGDMTGGLAFEKRAIAVDPSCYKCFGAAANMLNVSGHPGEALRAVSLAINLLPDGVRSYELETQADVYRRRLNENGGRLDLAATSPKAPAATSTPRASPPSVQAPASPAR